MPVITATHGGLLAAVVDGREVGRVRVRPGTSGITELYVDPAHRGRGYGSRLVAAAERRLRAQGRSRADVELPGPDSGFFERLGYGVVAQQRARELAGASAAEGVGLVTLADPGRRLAALVDEYALDLQEDEHLTPGAARHTAERRLAELRNPHDHMCTVTARGAEVGWAWIGPPRRAYPGMGWLFQIEIDEPYRGRGFGTRALTAVQGRMRDQGLSRIGLDVHGANTRARRLYDRLGFAVTAQQMVKDLRGSRPARTTVGAC
ncbi:GNAT family N-acetyltransferase [Actinoplanes sp. RD1]|uniref:GNAT family N-acetyltransferase n=1 Tax=Actinoplanes sp. RD1 TaxID=3064538 RepID=UPI002740A125|nr:GNAT family N-acetyltransferase [Actinoplanes sp. RD1]